MAIEEIAYIDGLVNPYSDATGRELFAVSRFDIDREMVQRLVPKEYPLLLPFLEGRAFSYKLVVLPDGTGEWQAIPTRDEAVNVVFSNHDAQYNANKPMIYPINEVNPLFILENKTEEGEYLLRNVYRWVLD